jgi:hypothetical protein
MINSEPDCAELDQYQHTTQQRRTFPEHLLLADGLPPREGYGRNRIARVASA